MKILSNTQIENNVTSNLIGNASTADKLKTARSISLTGDASGSANFDGSKNVSINVTVNDDSHNHVISNIDGLQAELNSTMRVIKLASGTDLNTIYDNGVYVSDSDANSNTIVNRPPGTSGFVVYVNTIYGSGVGGRQFQYAIVRPTSKVYVRSKSENASWSSWVEFYTTNNKPTWDSIQSKPSSFNPSSHTHKVTDLETGYLTTHPENHTSIVIPFIFNDLAFLTKKGGTVTAYTTTDTDFTKLTLTKTKETPKGLLDSVFDGTTSYFYVPDYVGKNDNYVIDIECHKNFPWGNQFYIDFGAVTWRANKIYIYVTNKSDKVNNKYALVGSNTSNSRGNFSCSVSYEWTNENGEVQRGFNLIRIVLTDFNSATQRRISQIGLVSYASLGTSEVYLSRGGDSLYGDLTPHTDNTYNLGSSSNKWKNIYANNYHGDNFYGNSSSADKLKTSRIISLGGDISGSATFDGSSDITIEASVSNNSHNHTIDNVDGLQEALNKKVDSVNGQTGSVIMDATKIPFDEYGSGGGTIHEVVTHLSDYTGSLAYDIMTGVIGVDYKIGVDPTLKQLIETGGAGEHTHDEYLPTSGGTVTGSLNVNGEVKVSNKFSMKYNDTENSLDFVFLG